MSYQQTVTVYSVEERLPDAGKDVRVWRCGDWHDGFNSGPVASPHATWFVFESGGESLAVYDVTHWHELPGPPGVECEPCYGTGEADFQDEGGASWSETCARCGGTGRDNTGSTSTGGQP